MRFPLAALTLLVASSAFAVAPQYWRVRSADDFLAGDIDGFAVTSRGQLRPAPSVRKIATFNDPFVLSQANGSAGDRYFGTGNDGKIYRLHGTELKVLYTAPEPEIYALAWRDGALYAASSPNGKVYRIDPADGKASVFFDPKQAYIWALTFTPNGDLLAATGVEGKLFRVDSKGEGKLLFTAPETHVRCLAVRRDGTVLAGGSGKGRIYEISPSGATHALFDSPLSEISTIYVDPSGTAWAAGATTVLPTTPPSKSKSTNASGSSSDAKKQSSDAAAASATPTAEVTVTIDDNASSPSGNGELYRIHADGFVETVRKFDRELVYAMTGASDGSLLLATGPQGRIYSIHDGETSLLATIPEKQVVSISTEGGATAVTTTNSGAVYLLDNSPSSKAEYRSTAKDVERFSRFGHYRVTGTDLGGNHIAIAFRSGNTRTPDATWSGWSTPSPAAEGAIDAPPGRFIQWKLTMPRPASDMIVEAVDVAFMNRNVAPVIDGIAVAEPAVVYISNSFPAPPQVVEATNPDENGIFTSIDSAKEKNETGGKKVFRKGFRTISWRAHDENGDSLRYSLAFRRQGSDKWLRLRDNMDDAQLNFDTSQLPDGTYELKLIATDVQDNAADPLSATKEGVELQVDNTPPSITVSSSGEDVVVHVTDAMSPIGRVEYSIDAEKWIRINPIDGISDSSDETYRLRRSDVAGKFVVVRAVDAFFNVATSSLSLR